MAQTSSDAAQTWDERASTWDDQDEAHVYAAQAFASLQPLVEQHLGDWSELRALDFGAGTGLLTAMLAPRCREIVAVDISPKMIEVLATKISGEGWSHVRALAGELGQLMTAVATLREPFDLVVASSVCSFLPDFPSELERLSSLLRPGGLFVQWDWHEDAAGEWASGFSFDAIRSAYERARLEPIVVDIGFTFSFDGNEMNVLRGAGRR